MGQAQLVLVLGRFDKKEEPVYRWASQRLAAFAWEMLLWSLYLATPSVVHGPAALARKLGSPCSRSH